MKKKVLIFGGGSYNAGQIYFSLKDTLRFHPILASSNDNHSTFICKEAVTDLPYDSEPDFIEKLNACIKKTNAEFIIPTHDTAALKMMENEEAIEATIVCSPLETARICRLKSLTYQTLRGMDFVPETYEMTGADKKYPLFAKEDAGQGGRNAHLIRNQDDLNRLDQRLKYVFCEYLPGEEITIDCFTDRYGNLRYAMPRRRERLLNGISARSVVLPFTDEIGNIVERISSKIKFRGYWFIQCRQDKNGRYKLMEISTRFAGTFTLSKNRDVNLPLLALQDFSEMDIDILPNECPIISDKSYIDRYHVEYEYERVYIDFDDTLVFDRKRYHTEAMRFLYQCLNQKKRLVLITKHAYDIRETAGRIRFDLGIFDEIIEVPEDEPKCRYMDRKMPSIFIDNAFSERKEVKQRLGMPTFDVTNIEALIDWSD